MEDDAEDSAVEEVLCYRQRVEKSTGGEMRLMQWSPTQDLLAAAFADNSVGLNRLSWQRIWSLPSSDVPVTVLTWRPDGRVLAVGKGDGSVCLHSVEDGRALHRFSAAATVISMDWTQQSEESLPSAAGMEYKDMSAEFLPPLPALDTSYTERGDEREGKHHADPKELKSSSKRMNVLVVGDEVGRTHICVSGVFLAASTADVLQQNEGHVLLTCMSDDLQLVSATILRQHGNEGKLHLCTLNTALISARSRELRHLALEFGHIGSLLEYMSATLKSMHEAWEDVLLMMDTKLARYSSTLPEGRTVSDELLVLLACGRARPELQTFLVEELTAKGVKRMGLSLEMSYTSIRKYTINYLNSAIQQLQYHLGEMLGMARWYSGFGVLGLSENALQDCINNLGTFALKCQEMMLAIDDSLQSIKTFFTWIYVVILKLSDEKLPNGLKEHMSPEELKCVTEFLRKRLTKASESDTQTFNLEVVGQYLTDEDLKYVEERPPSLWEELMSKSNLKPETEPWLFLPSPRKSLLQLFHTLHKSIDTAFTLPTTSIQRSFSHDLDLEIATLKLKDGSLSETARRLQPLMGLFMYKDRHYIFFPVTNDNDIAVLSFGDSSGELNLGKFYISNIPPLDDHGFVKSDQRRCQLLSLQCYSSDALSVLLQYPTNDRDNPSYAVAQLPLETVAMLPLETVMSHDIVNRTISIPSKDVGPSLAEVLSLGAFKSGALAVAGSRKLAAVLSYNGKKIRLFDVDAEEDEEN